VPPAPNARFSRGLDEAIGFGTVYAVQVQHQTDIPWTDTAMTVLDAGNLRVPATQILGDFADLLTRLLPVTA
jgi:hypothetical protein